MPHSAVSGASVLAQNHQWQSCCVAHEAEPQSSFPPKVLELSPVAPCTAEGQRLPPFPGLERCSLQITNSEIAHRNFPLQKQHYRFSWNYQALAMSCQRDYHTHSCSQYVSDQQREAIKVSLMRLSSVNSWTSCASVSFSSAQSLITDWMRLGESYINN